MGVTITDNDEQLIDEMSASKPKERQFQVVPVPGLFKRGRWECWDYKQKSVEGGEEIIDYTEKSDKTAATTALTVARSTVPEETTQGLNHTVSEPRLIPTGEGSAGLIGATEPDDVPLRTSESTTILVTSIAPPSVTPVQGTPSSNISPLLGVPVENPRNDASSVEVLSGTDTLSTVTGTLISPTALSVSPSSQVGTTPSVTLSPGQSLRNSAVSLVQQTAHLDVQTEMTRPKSATFSSGPTLTINTESDDAATAPSAASGTNVVPIDNKIEQAMDLVKTHLTFAVREEVEILRSTIVELEAKVTQLESQNQVLKQFAPAEVLSQLTLLVQQKTQQQSSPMAQPATMPALTTTAQQALYSPPSVPLLSEAPVVDSGATIEGNEETVPQQ